MQLGALAHSDDLAEADKTMGGDGSVFGFGTIDGRVVAFHANDPTVKGASGGTAGKRLRDIQQRFMERFRVPVFELAQSGGVRITEAMTSRFAGFPGPELGDRHARGRRQLLMAAVLGSYYAPWLFGMADFTVMTQAANASLTSPGLLEEATGQAVTPQELGGADVHARITGQVDVVVDDEEAAMLCLRRVFSYLPSNHDEAAPVAATDDPAERMDLSLREIVPEQANRVFDTRKVILKVVDEGSFIEMAPGFARNLITGLARLDGIPVAVMGNQSKFLAGTIDVKAAMKARRMFSLCEFASLPTVSFHDIPGILTTKEQEHARLVTETYDLAVARFRPSGPKLSVVVRKGYGYGFFAMSGTDPQGHTFAWPTARIAFTGPEPAAAVVYRREAERAPDPKAYLSAKADEFRDLATPWQAAELNYIDDIIDPAMTRPVLIRALRTYPQYRRAAGSAARTGQRELC
jgi:propionyl-CoA carboxylase beta chain